MNVEQFLLILKARARTVAWTIAATVALTAGISLVLPKTYKASTTVLLNYKGIDPVTGLSMGAALMPGYVATQVDILNSQSVALRVVDTLKLAENAATKQAFAGDADGAGDIRVWLAALLQKKLDVIPSKESSVIDITFKNPNPAFAALVANAFAAEYQQTTIALKVAPLRQATAFFNEQIRSLRDTLEAAQGRLSKYQQDKGLVSIDNRLDVESARLNDLSTQLVVVQGQLAEAVSRQHEIRSAGASASPDIMANPLIQNLKASLAQAEARFADVVQKLGVNHPQYQGTKAEVDKLRAQLDEHIGLTSGSVVGGARILQQREAEVRSALQTQKTRVLALNRSRDELAILAREVESVQRAYEASVARFNQTSMEGQAKQADVAILNPALAPTEPSSPKLWINMILALFFGTFLGLGMAMLAEMADRRIRSSSELAQATDAMVLGVLGVPAGRVRKWAWMRTRTKGMALAVPG